MSRVQASLVEWMDEKGYGFARLPGGTERIFVHAKNLEENMPRPKKGDELELEIVNGRNGKPAARHVRILDGKDVARILPYHLVTASLLLIILELVVILGGLPYSINLLYVVMGGLSAFLYRRDKIAAIDGKWRVSERTLLTVDLFGGIIGGLFAQHHFKHKKSKASFQISTFCIVAAHVVVLTLFGTGLLSL